jgi:hypothetical protein
MEFINAHTSQEIRGVGHPSSGSVENFRNPSSRLVKSLRITLHT